LRYNNLPIFTAPSDPGVVKIPAPRADSKEFAKVWPLNDWQAEGL